MIRKFKRTILGAAMCTFAVYPYPAFAFGGNWLPNIFQWFTSVQEEDDSVPEGYTCRWKNGFGDCVVYRFAKEAEESSSASSASGTSVSSAHELRTH